MSATFLGMRSSAIRWDSWRWRLKMTDVIQRHPPCCSYIIFIRHTCHVVNQEGSSFIKFLWSLKYEISNIFWRYVYCTGFIHQESRTIQSHSRGHPGIAADITVLKGRSRPPSMVSRLARVLIYNWPDVDLSWCTEHIYLWWERGMLWRHMKLVSFPAWNEKPNLSRHFSDSDLKRNSTTRILLFVFMEVNCLVPQSSLNQPPLFFSC